MVCLGYMENNKYEKGKIYLITDVAYTKCYYGSTCEELSKRFWRHKGVYKTFLDGKCSYKHSICQLFDEFGVENCKIELVELFPTQSKIELLQREGYYIKNNACVNKEVAGRTPQEYYKDNKEKCAKWNKEWHIKNRDNANERGRNNYHKNRDKLMSIVDCYCGSSFQLQNRSHHIKTKKHQDWLKQQEQE